MSSTENSTLLQIMKTIARFIAMIAKKSSKCKKKNETKDTVGGIVCRLAKQGLVATWG